LKLNRLDYQWKVSNTRTGQDPVMQEYKNNEEIMQKYNVEFCKFMAKRATQY
jgi:hypothetical protein